MRHIYQYRSLVGDLVLAFLLAFAILLFVGTLAAGALIELRRLWRKWNGST